MSDIDLSIQKSFFGRRLYIYLALLAAIPIWLMINGYVKIIGVEEDEAVATGATAFFIVGVFVGRYLAQFWVNRTEFIQNRMIGICALLAVVLTCWLFFHADFPLGRRVAINLLLFWLPFMLISLAMGILIKLLRTITRNRLNAARSVAAHNKSELHLLQSQLSPHFLFNTLNNLYGLSLTQHEKVPPLLLKLSELLRYSVYDAGELFVPLKQELDYIMNYIEFEKIRVGERLRLNVDIENLDGRSIRIAPMLLIVFIENAFKHSKNTADDSIFIDIALKTWGNFLLFSVKNSRVKTRSQSATNVKNSGFGLASVNKRLALLYPADFNMTIEDEEDYYNVLLQLKIR